MGRIGEREALSHLAQALDDPDEEVVQCVVRAIASIRGDEAFETLNEAFESDDERSLRRRGVLICRALSNVDRLWGKEKIGAAFSIRSFPCQTYNYCHSGSYWEHPSLTEQDVYITARRMEVRDRLAMALMERLQQCKREPSHYFIDCLGVLKAQSAFEALARITDDASRPKILHRTVLYAMANIAPLPALRKAAILLRDKKYPHRHVAAEIIELVVSKTGGHNQIILDLLTDSDLEVRSLTLNKMTRICNSWSVDKFVRDLVKRLATNDGKFSSFSFLDRLYGRMQRRWIRYKMAK